MEDDNDGSAIRRQPLLPRSGELLIYDFRSPGHIASSASLASLDRPLKVVQWNIERGYRLPEIVACLLRHDADIICLQELDIACERSGGANNARVLAETLQMKCAFVCEFEEIYSPLRSKRNQGGGVHGNAVLSKWDFVAHPLEHQFEPFEWEKRGTLMGEPRHGKRHAVVASVAVPGYPVPIVAYSIHLEVFCGIYGRLREFGDILKDAHLRSATNPYQLVFGDLNTMGHGLARLYPHYCSDGLRWRTLGSSEARWWQTHLFSTSTVDFSPVNTLLKSPLAAAILTSEDLASLRNPHLYDPFCVDQDTTLQGYRGIYKGKLDWTLLRGFMVEAKGMDNLEYRWSDHKLMWLELEKPDESACAEGEDVGRAAYRMHLENQMSERLGAKGLRKLNMSLLRISAILLFAALLVPLVLVILASISHGYS